MHNRMIPVHSTNIGGYIYLGGTHLVIAFTSGAYYRYDNVPQQVVEDFVSAQSKGKFLNQHIKPAYDSASLSEQDLEALLQTCPETKVGSQPTPKKQTYTREDVALFLERFPVLSVMF